MEEPRDFGPNTLSSLGYDVHAPTAHGEEHAPEKLAHDEDIDEGNQGTSPGGDRTPFDSRSYPPSTHQRKSNDLGMGIISVGSLVGDAQQILKSLASNGFAKPLDSSQPNAYARRPRELKDSIEDLKMGLLIETLLSAPDRKIKAKGYTQPASRPPSSLHWPNLQVDEETLSESPDSLRKSKNLIIFVEDYLQINATFHGGRFLDKLNEVVAAKRSEGKVVIVVGISSNKDLMPDSSKSSINELEASHSYGQMRTIVVPVLERSDEQELHHQHKAGIKKINIRHLRNMIRRLAPAPEQRSASIDNWNMEIDSKTAFLVDLEDSIWPIDRVNRVATLTLGYHVGNMPLRTTFLQHALTGIHDSDQAKYKWIKEQEEVERKIHEKSHKPRSDMDERLRKLRDKSNRHERQLLSGVVDAASIKTTFADIQAPQETIDGLKTLTSLSLARPDAFTYGVLATDRIPGVLLYGPPGTGKTLLAKAVAKESASTMLEVSGSSESLSFYSVMLLRLTRNPDIHNMYVGESEKNVRAIFSLAKKLAPCVVFIDEADAILASRSGRSGGNTHRDIINQFLREWDGMTETNAFLMVATNRPFDLDEASLRRLPRRLLVDLPVEKDREAILKIHLKNEILDPEVSLSKLASETPFYSGSDLKNVCVAAALACVREEFQLATEHNKSIADGASQARKYEYAQKRTLCPRHFAKAMDEISASISEDMTSLSAIRKFDAKYGDRKGRRKKSAYGFKTAEESEAKESDALRVRNQ